ncbi:MAG: pyruvate kinase alpha/beta domain-containing protein [Candidatus Bathyarchaeota archaeon]|jgi:hypothetical protein
MKKDILYFERPGKGNTEELLVLAKERAAELGIRDVVVATSHGGTALRVREVFDDPGLNLVAVTICEGFKEKGWTITDSERRGLEERGIVVLTSVHALGADVSSAFSEKYGGTNLVRAVRDTFYRFGQGMKVASEIVMMAADAGLIPMDREIMAIAGTGDGADTCVVVKPAYPRRFFELEIREIIAKPRSLS